MNGYSIIDPVVCIHGVCIYCCTVTGFHSLAIVATLWEIGIMAKYLGFSTHCHKMVKINPTHFTTGFLTGKALLLGMNPINQSSNE